MASFLQDHNVAYALGLGLTLRGHPTKIARDLHLTRTHDHALLAIAARNRWAFVTHNSEDFILLHRAWVDWATEWGVQPPPIHAGILVLPNPISPGRAVESILAFVNGRSLDNRLFRLTHQGNWEELI